MHHGAFHIWCIGPHLSMEGSWLWSRLRGIKEHYMRHYDVAAYEFHETWCAFQYGFWDTFKLIIVIYEIWSDRWVSLVCFCLQDICGYPSFARGRCLCCGLCFCWAGGTGCQPVGPASHLMLPSNTSVRTLAHNVDCPHSVLAGVHSLYPPAVALWLTQTHVASHKGLHWQLGSVP